MSFNNNFNAPVVSLVYILLLSLVGCNEFHENAKQVISASDAVFPIKGTSLFVMARVDLEKIRANNKSVVTEKDIARLRRTLYAPMTSDKNGQILNVQLTRVDHCYKSDSSYSAYAHLVGDYYLESSSKEGCFEQGDKRAHTMSIYRIVNDRMYMVTAPDFVDWAKKLSTIRKLWLGVTLEEVEVDDVLAGAGKKTKKTIATVDSLSAYEAFVTERMDKMNVQEIYLSPTEPTALEIESANVLFDLSQRKASAALARQKAIENQGLHFCNESNESLSLVLGQIEDTQWVTRGWYNVDVGACKRVATNITGKNYYYMADGNRGSKWAGEYTMCIKEKDAFHIKGFKDCESRGFKSAKFGKIEIDQTTADFKQRFTGGKLSKIDSLDIGENVYVQGLLSDELATIIRIDKKNNSVKVLRAEDRTAKWVSINDVITRQEAQRNDFGRAAVGAAMIVCLFSPESCQK